MRTEYTTHQLVAHQKAASICQDMHVDKGESVSVSSLSLSCKLLLSPPYLV